MNKQIIIAALALGIAAPVFAADNELSAEKKADGWIALFDGKTLDGWSIKSGFATYKIEDGAIVGTTAPKSPNTFLCTDKNFRDFELTFDVKLDSKELNSGVQTRSKLKDDGKFGGRVYGPQVEIEASPGQAGYIYGEAAGGRQSPEPQSKDKAVNEHSHFKNGEWNTYRVVEQGRHIQTWINGTKVADLMYDEKLYAANDEGLIGLQVHGVGDKGPYSVRWKNIIIKPLPAAK